MPRETPIPGHPIRIVAKTGTLNFVSTLAGYVEHAAGARWRFRCSAPISTAAPPDRGQMERPPGGRTYNTRAKRLQQVLLRRWGAMFG
jgi:D-alanyl-D-alanine carboxypeptidase/D-alanyl-D-alanine-endopeptidase (penicillin-binding protein 4)